MSTEAPTEYPSKEELETYINRVKTSLSEMERERGVGLYGSVDENGNIGGLSTDQLNKMAVKSWAVEKGLPKESIDQSYSSPVIVFLARPNNESETTICEVYKKGKNGQLAQVHSPTKEFRFV